MTGTYYDNTVTHTLNSTTNAALFEAVWAYLIAGNSALVLYNGDGKYRRLVANLRPCCT